jgi:hypothetical protein
LRIEIKKIYDAFIKLIISILFNTIKSRKENKTDIAGVIYNKFIIEMNDTLNENRTKSRIEQIDIVYKKHSLEHAWIRLYIDFYYSVKKSEFSEYILHNYQENNTKVVQKLVFLTDELIKINNNSIGSEFLSIIKELKSLLDNERSRLNANNKNDGFIYSKKEIDDLSTKLYSRYNKISLNFFFQTALLIKKNN